MLRNTTICRRAMAELGEQVQHQRKVITHKEAPAFFNHDVKPRA